jgi:hypothetical protein
MPSHTRANLAAAFGFHQADIDVKLLLRKGAFDSIEIVSQYWPILSQE